jgi:hypothetical protein
VSFNVREEDHSEVPSDPGVRWQTLRRVGVALLCASIALGAFAAVVYSAASGQPAGPSSSGTGSGPGAAPPPADSNSTAFALAALIGSLAALLGSIAALATAYVGLVSVRRRESTRHSP